MIEYRTIAIFNYMLLKVDFKCAKESINHESDFYEFLNLPYFWVIPGDI